MSAIARSGAVGRRALRGLLRLPGRVAPIPGWFPLVVERIHPLADDGQRPVRFSRGDAHFELDLDEYTQRRIFYRCHEESEAAWVRRFLRTGDAVVDVGANIGFFTVLAATVVGTQGRVFSFEPFQGSFRSLERNVALNELDNVTVERAAVAEAPGSMTLGLDEETIAHGSTGGFTEEGNTARFTVPAVTLDESLELVLGDGAARLLKIDVEGIEPKVLRGAQKTLADRPPDALLVELNRAALEGHGYGEQDVLDPLLEAGYSLHEIGRRGRLRPFRPYSDAPAPWALPGSLRESYRSWRLLRNLVALRPGIEP
jgi:FkbM family methyltransferase